MRVGNRFGWSLSRRFQDNIFPEIKMDFFKIGKVTNGGFESNFKWKEPGWKKIVRLNNFFEQNQGLFGPFLARLAILTSTLVTIDL